MATDGFSRSGTGSRVREPVGTKLVPSVPRLREPVESGTDPYFSRSGTGQPNRFPTPLRGVGNRPGATRDAGTGSRSGGGGLFTRRDEADLRLYFALALPPMPGARSNFGAMCERRALKRTRDSSEQPTPFVVNADGTTSGAPWTEIVDCQDRGSSAAAFAVEDAFAAYVDARSCVRRVHRVLATLAATDREVLSCHYSHEASPDDLLGPLTAVASLTAAVVEENRDRAARDKHEPIEATVRDIWMRSVAGAQLDETRRLLARVKEQAEALLLHARDAYACARGPR